MKHTITVLQDDIDNGVPGTPERCAIALAAKRELFVDIVSVSGTRLSTGTESGLLPTKARGFIPRFDQKLPVEPFKFEIDMQPRVGALVVGDKLPPFATGGLITGSTV